MTREYESDADRTDQDISEAGQNLKRVKDNADSLMDFADKHKKDLSPTTNTTPTHTSTENNGSKPNINDKKNSTAAGNIGSKNATEIGKDSAKSAGKEVGKEAAKEGVKQGSKAGAEAALASTGAGAAVAAGLEATDKLASVVKDIGNNTAKGISQAGEDANSASGKIKAYKRKAQNMAEDDSIVKVFVATFGVIIGLVIFIIVIIISIIFTILAPVMNLFTAIHNGFSTAGSALEHLSSDATFEDVAYYYKDNIKDALNKAFDETCYNEVLQIVEEQDYDLDATMETYKENTFPYVLDGENCNVNYLEILTVMSMAEKNNILNFDHDSFMKLFEDPEFLRCLYDLSVEKVEVFDEDEYDSDGTLIHKGTGELLYTYGNVKIQRYPLKKIFDYFGVDPYGPNFNYPTLTNYQALSIIETYTKQEAMDIEWGSSVTSKLLDYTNYTGEITTSGENIYANEMYKDEVVGNYNIVNGVPVYAQSDPAWGQESYGSKTIAKQGCCLTSMAMVSSYMTGETITPLTISHLIKEKYHGALVRSDIANHYGFKQYITQARFNTPLVVGELAADRILIVHIKGGHLGHNAKDSQGNLCGHYVVLSGVDSTGPEATFTINDPAGGKTYTFTASEAAYHLDYIWSYGK